MKVLQLAATALIAIGYGNAIAQQAALPEAAQRALAGEWTGTLTIPGGYLTLVYRFETDAAGHLVGFVDSPDQGATGLAMTDIGLADGTLTFKVPQAQAEYSAKLDQEQMLGTWTQGPVGMPLTMSKGEYRPAAAVLSLSADAMAALSGAWHGMLGPLNLIVRFEPNAQGQPVAFLDSPDQNAKDIPVSEASFVDGKLSFRIAPLDAEYSGRLTGETITGQWTQHRASSSLTLTRQ